jgi:hypothetical protein
VLGDQTVLETELGVNVVVDSATGRKRVISEPVGTSVFVGRLVLGELHLEVPWRDR